MYDKICYKKPFLKEVIVRIDFASAISSIDKAVPQRVANAALERFPILEERKGLTQKLMLSAAEIHHKRQEFTEWNYYGRDRKKRLALAPSFLYITYTRYSSYEDLKSDFINVVTMLFEYYPDLRIARLGLRYINKIDQKEHDPFRWNDLVNPRLLGIFDSFYDERNSINRLFHILEFKYDDDIQLKFQFGVPNPDYPANIRVPLFVLDMDAHFDGLQVMDELRKNLDLCHEHIQKIFETSITKKLRGLMNEQG